MHLNLFIDWRIHFAPQDPRTSATTSERELRICNDTSETVYVSARLCEEIQRVPQFVKTVTAREEADFVRRDDSGIPNLFRLLECVRSYTTEEPRARDG